MYGFVLRTLNTNFHRTIIEEIMYEFLSQNQMYIVLIITLLIWSGIVWYLLRIDKKIRQIEKRLKKDE
jgi:CcmD family protein